MPIVTIQEIIDLVIMIAIVGFIFKDYVKIPVPKNYDPLTQFKNKSLVSDRFKHAIIVTAPAIALHELGHKVAALSFGLEATFHAAYTWLGIGLVLKLIGAPFLFFVPGFVSYSGGSVEPLARAFIAFAGPLINLILFLLATLAIKQNWFDKKYFALLHLTKQINLFLFAFNLIPLGFFDGAQVFRSLMQVF